MDRTTFGWLLRDARQRALLTLEGLSDASGVSVRAISDMERGQSLPRQATLRELMDALELDEDGRRTLARATRRPTQQVPQQLPPDLAVFRGHEAALAAVHASTAGAAEHGSHVVVSAIGGMAGVGKTTLAVHWAHRVAARFPDGQLYVNLRGFEATGQPLDPGEALGGFLDALGVPSTAVPRATEDRSALFRQQTALRQLIVVLDNARDAEQVRPLLPASTGCLTIVTSRNQLPGLAATEGASLISLDVWTREEALAALAARIGEERCRSEPEAAVELVELCGCLPLAVSIVGAQLSAAPQVRLRVGVRELREASPRLDALAADDHRVDVRAVFSWSYRTLSARTARFFRHLAIHAGPALSAEAAASLAGVDMSAARRHLRELTTVSLLSRDAEGRYVLHDLVRAYGAELLEAEQDDRHAAETRLLDYLTHNAHVANRFMPRYRTELTAAPAPGVIRVTVDTREEALDWFRLETATAATALRSTEDHRLLRHRVDLTHNWVCYHAVAGRWAEEITAARAGLDAALALDDPAAVVSSCAYLSRALVEMGCEDEADEPVAMMLAQLHRLDPDLRARTLRRASWVRDRQGRYAEGLENARAALDVLRGAAEGPDGPQDGHTGRAEYAAELNTVAWFLTRLADHRQAIATCEEAIPLLRATGNRNNEAATWDTLGHAQHSLGDLDASVAAYREALRLYEEVLDEDAQADVLDHLAAAHLARGDVREARESWTRAANLLSALRSPRATHMRSKAKEIARPRPGV